MKEQIPANDMKISRRSFLKKGLAGTLLLGAASLPAPITALAANPSASATQGRRAKRILILGLDGICVAGFQQAHTPNLDALLAKGALSLETRVVMPSVTLPNWTSHLTASGPELHGVVDNGWTMEKHKLPGIESDADGYYPSVFKVLKDACPNLKTAFYYNWPNLIYPYNKKYFDEYFFEENDAYLASYEKAFNFMSRNREDPMLVFLYSVHTDHAGHKHKWMSPEYIRSIEEADENIGMLLDKMKREGLYDDTHFMFITDHGGIGYGHGGVSTDEMIVPWGITGPGITHGLKMKEPNNTVNTASVILHLFHVKQPLCWTGEVPKSIFK